jgi:hypothetical protein
MTSGSQFQAKRQENYKAFYTLKDAQQKANDKAIVGNMWN